MWKNGEGVRVGPAYGRRPPSWRRPSRSGLRN